MHRSGSQLDGRSTCDLYGDAEIAGCSPASSAAVAGDAGRDSRVRGFVPLPYQPENNDIPVRTPPTGYDALRTIAVSRVYLDNFDHITAYWVGMGLKLAQVA